MRANRLKTHCERDERHHQGYGCSGLVVILAPVGPPITSRMHRTSEPCNQCKMQEMVTVLPEPRSAGGMHPILSGSYIHTDGNSALISHPRARVLSVE
jgi:hypothetical protein